MKGSRFLSLGVGTLALLLASGTVARAQCPAAGSAQIAKLVDYVEKKLKVPTGISLEVAENSLVGATCYRKLVLQSRETDKVAYRFELFASPDMRFLSKELMDMTIDPLVEERQKMAALNSGLLAPGAPAQGRVDAPVTIAIFSDFQCPYCARLAETVKDVLPDEADRARLVFHYFPLGMHSWARPAAEAAACAQQQGDAYFWSLHDFLFDHQKEISRDSLLEKLAGHTESLQGFDRQKFDRCVVTRAAISVVDRDLAFGRENGIRATPTVFVNGKQTRIVAPEQLRTLIRQLSQAPRSTAPAGQQ